MKKKYKILNLFYFNIFIFLSLFASNQLMGQQNVFSRSDSGTNLWWNDSQKPWYYETWNSIERRPDMWPFETRNNIFIGHNNYTTMTLNGVFFKLRTFTIQSSSTFERVYNSTDGGGISLAVGYYKQSGSGNQIFNVPIGVDASSVIFSAQNGNTVFSSDFFINSNVAVFEGDGNFNITGVAQGNGGSITKNGSGTLTLSNTNTYTGLTTINAGILQFFNSNGATLPTTNSVTVNSNGTLKVSSNQTLNQLNLSGGTLDIDSGMSLTVQNLNFNSGNIIGSGSLITTPKIVSQLSKIGTVGAPLNYTISANFSPSSYSATGLPAGLSINTTTGVISGTPTESGTFNVNISATNVVGTDVETLELMVIPATTINASQCGQTINNNARVLPTLVASATGYKFNIYDNQGEFITSIENPNNFFRFSQINFVFGATYQVKVQVKQGQVYGAEGPACSITLSSIPTTTLETGQCGSAINYNDRVYPILVSGATGYAFDIYDAGGSNLITTIENPYFYFTFSQFNFIFGATYQVKVRVKRGSVYSAPGAACVVTLNGIPTTSLIASQCGSLIEPTTSIYPISLRGASGYLFKIYDSSGTNLLASIENSYNYFRFSQFNFTYGTSYQVRVVVRQGDVYGAEGLPCTVTLNSIPTSAIVSSRCGTTVNHTDTIYSTNVTGATGYAFDIYDSSGLNLIQTIENPFNYFRFSQFAFAFGATYQVRVRVKSGSFYGNQGNPCVISLIDFPTSSIISSQCSSTVNPSDRIYPVGVVGATGYAFDIYDASGNNFITTIENSYFYFRFSQFNFTYGTTYQVKVRVRRGNVYSVAGSSCSITIENIPTTTLTQCGTAINFNAEVYPIAVTNATGYAFDIYNLDGVTLIATVENTYNFFRFTQINYVLGEKYYVRVRVKRGNQYGAQGDACLVQLNDPNARGEVVVKEDASNNSIINGNLQAYPNPFTSTFNITPIEGETETLFYQVYDVTGKMIESRSVEVSEIAQHAIGEYYPTGMYLVIARQGAMTQTFKMVKQ